MEKLIHHDLSNKVLEALYAVHYKIGSGLLEKVYENAVTIELKYRNIPFKRQKIYKVFYRGELAGEYIADIVVDDKIIIETKAVKELNNIMRAQLLNYLKISGLRVGYLVNFSKSVLEWKRLVS